MSLTAHRVIQYISLILIFLLLGGAYWYFSVRAAVSNKTASKDGLVGYWSFDEGSGTLAGDASGSGNTGTLTNGPVWADGKLGKALNFDGVNDYVAINNSLLPSINGSLSFWAKSSNNTDSYRDMVSISSGASGGTIFAIQFVNNPDNGCTLDHSAKLVLRDDGGTLTQLCSGIAMNDGKWHHYVGTAVSGSQQFYVDGVLKDTDTVVPGAATFTRFGIGATNRSTAVQFFPGQIDDVRVYNRALTSTEVTNLYNLGAAKLNASKNALLTDGLVGLWSFDGADLSGTTAYDRSGNGNNGTLTDGPAAAIGKVGQALNFDGVNDYVGVADSNSLDMTANWSVATWVKFDSFYTGNCENNAIINKGHDGLNGFYGLDITEPDELCGPTTGAKQASFSIRFSDGTSAGVSGNTQNLTTGIWYHLVGTYDGTSLKIFLNGVQDGSTSVSGKTVAANTDLLYFGKMNNGSFPYWVDGSIDDVRIYNRALSATEVQALYALGDADKINSSMAQPQGTGRLDSGLQSYWSLDENTGTTTTDASTNALTGTLTNGPAWITGQIGYGIDFDGTDDSITTPDADVLDVVDGRNFTLSGWFNRDTFTTDDTVVAKRNGITAAENGYLAYIDDATDKLTFEVSDGTDEYQLESASTFVATGWHHFAVVWNDTVSTETKLYIDGRAENTTNTGTFANVNSLANAVTFNLGAESDAGNPFDGKLDEVRLYNRTMTADEVDRLYRLTTPTSVDTALKGYWSFDGADLSGTTAYDRSGSANNGTLTNGPVAAIGKLGQALNFDGVNDYVNIGVDPKFDGASAITISAWIKPNASMNDSTIVGKSTVVANQIYFWVGHSGLATDKISWNAGPGWLEATQTLTLNEWTHVVGVADASGHKIFYNGVLISSNSSAIAISASDPQTWKIGSNGGSRHFNGSIDDVRIYNRALSTDEVTALYNFGR